MTGDKPEFIQLSFESLKSMYSYKNCLAPGR